MQSLKDKILGVIVHGVARQLRRKRLFIFVAIAIFLSVVIFTNIIRPTYSAKALILLEDNSEKEQTRSSAGSSSSATLATFATMATLTPIMKQVIETLDLKDRFGKQITSAKLLKESIIINKLIPQPFIQVKQHEGAHILEVRTYSPDPKEAANMANTLADIYVKESPLVSNNQYENKMFSIEKQISSIKGRYYGALNDYKDFKIQKGIYDLAKQSEKLIEYNITLKDSFDKNELSIVEHAAIVEKAKEEIDNSRKLIRQSEEYSESDIFKDLKKKLNELTFELRKKSVDITKNHPDYKQIEKQLNTVRDFLKKESKVSLSSSKYAINPAFEELAVKAAESLVDLEASLAKRKIIISLIEVNNKELKRLSLQGVDYEILKSKVKINKDLYNEMRTHYIKAKTVPSLLRSNQGVPLLRIIERAELPHEIYFPDKTLNYLLGFFLGVLGAALAPFVADYRERVLARKRTPEQPPVDVKELEEAFVETREKPQEEPLTKQQDNLKLPHITTIHRTRYLTNRGLVTTIPVTSHIPRDFDKIIDHVIELYNESGLKTLLFTSTLQSEGKTTLCINMSIIMSRAGFRVLILDFNLKAPDVHSYFKMPNKKGLVECLNGQAEVLDVVEKTHIERLDLLCAGDVASEHGVLFNGGTIDNVFNTLRDSYDLIAIDTPAMFVSNHALNIGSYADGVLHVVEYNKITPPMIDKFLGLLVGNGLNVKGYIINKAVRKTSK